MCRMKNAANKVWTKVKNINVTITGKIKLGFIEIAVAPLNTCRLNRACFHFWHFARCLTSVEKISYFYHAIVRNALRCYREEQYRKQL